MCSISPLSFFTWIGERLLIGYHDRGFRLMPVNGAADGPVRSWQLVDPLQLSAFGCFVGTDGAVALDVFVEAIEEAGWPVQRQPPWGFTTVVLRVFLLQRVVASRIGEGEHGDDVL